MSPKDFDKFSLDYFGSYDAGTTCKGIYFGNEPNKKYGNKVYESYINLQNPFYYFDNPGIFSIKYDKNKTNEDIIKEREQITQKLIKEGYDGVIMGQSQFIVFNPEQIKVIEKYDI